MGIPEKAALLMEHLVTHDGYPGHGYSQYSRNGDGTIEIVSVDGQDVQIAGGDRDCSSAVISCYTSLGVNCGGATYTGNMRACMTGSGNFKWIDRPTSYSAQPGDIYLNEKHHTAMCISPYGSARGDLLAQFSISEKGTIDGAEGDQNGRESNIKPFYDYPWDGDLVYIGGDVDAPAIDSNWANAYGDPNWFGPRMCKAWQEQRGTTADGIMSGQYPGNKRYFWALSGGVTYENDGVSELVRSIQALVGVTVDGHYGKESIKGVQRKLLEWGYDIGSSGIDGYQGTQTNCALARSLFDGRWR